MVSKRILTCLGVVVAASLLACAETRPPERGSEVERRQALVRERARISEIFKTISERNRTVKKSDEWLRQAYGGLQIRRLTDVPRARYGEFKKYVTNGAVYVIVHPGFYVFFENQVKLSSDEDRRAFPRKNIIERFGDSIPQEAFSFKIALEQEKLVREFLEFASEEKKLVIVLLPRDHVRHLAYGYVEGLDEYARYVNEMTNASESVLYLESLGWNNGVIETEDQRVLTAFLEELGVRTVFVGGGYIGRCVDDCYISLRKKFSYGDVILVPELLVMSFVDTVATHSALLTKKGRISFKEVRKYVDNYGVTMSEGSEIPKTSALSLYAPYRDTGRAR